MNVTRLSICTVVGAALATLFAAKTAPTKNSSLVIVPQIIHTS